MPSMNRRHVIGSSLAGLAGAAALSKLAHAGPLAPPPGLVRSSGKTLDQVEPRTAVSIETCPGDATCIYKIVSPGSYFCPSNLQGDSRIIIRITCSNVVLDCRGFSLTGAPGGTPGAQTPACISVDAGCTNIDCCDAVCGDAHYGVSAAGACVTISDLDCLNCDTGIEVGPASEVDDCRCQNCPVAGFACPDDPAALSPRGGHFSDCDAFACGIGFAQTGNCGNTRCRAHTCVTGFACTAGCDCDDCDAIACTTGFAGGDRFSSEYCRAMQCATGWSCGNDCCTDCSQCLDCWDMGFSAGARYTADSCICTAARHGMVCGTDAKINRCAMEQCDAGIIAGARAWITDTSVSRSTNVSATGLAEAGITVGDESDCDDCCVDYPTGHGFVTGASCSLSCCSACRCAPGYYGASCDNACDVTECTFTDCWGGIACGERCSVQDNVCVAAAPGGGPHIRLSSHCRCEDNSCDNAPIGVQLIPGATGCLVCSNSFHDCPTAVEFVQASPNAVAAFTSATNGWGGGVSSHNNIVH